MPASSQDDNVIASVEVTVSLDRREKETDTRIRDNGPVKTNLCKKNWWIQAQPGADIRAIRANVDACLAAVESDGIERFLGPLDWHRYPSVKPLFCDLHVFSGSAVIQWKYPGHIWIDLPGWVGRVSPKNVVEAVRREAPRNSKKLAASNAKQGHLVIYLDPTNRLARKSLLESDPPASSPHLPSEITDIWVIAETRSENEYIAWKASASSPWRRIGPLVLPERD